MMSHVTGITYDSNRNRINTTIAVDQITRIDSTMYLANSIGTALVTARVGEDWRGIGQYVSAYVPLAQLAALGIMDFECSRCAVVTRARDAFADKSTPLFAEAYYNLDTYLTMHTAQFHPFAPID